jgi:hypothetical protein
MRATESPATGQLTPLPKQIGLDGRLHDLPPEIERMRLFDHKAQLPGQTWLELAGAQRADHAMALRIATSEKDQGPRSCGPFPYPSAPTSSPSPGRDRGSSR